MKREIHVRICGRLGAKFPGPTRQQETESSQTGLRRRGESPVNGHRETNATAPVLDSTPLNYTQNAPISAIASISTVRPLGGGSRSCSLFWFGRVRQNESHH